MWAFQNLMRKQPKWRLKREKIVKNFRNFLFENDELLKKILLSKKFLKLIKEYAVIFSEFLGRFYIFQIWRFWKIKKVF